MIWPILTGILAIVLLASGGLQALQAAAVASALPFAFMLLIAIAGFVHVLFTHEYIAKPE